ncbi:hypothetical protein BJV77DRAFT_1153112 [Russula vinacea]|nr:hypothetical protein BJV77DRAFT_1153112 [Russula vinacea]
MSSDADFIEELADLSSAAPQLLGAVWNWFLYGILVVQFYCTADASPDNKYIKLLGTKILISSPLYSIFFWKPSKRCLVVPTSTMIVGSMVSLSVQLFFVYRIRVLSRLCEKRSRWLCIIICLVTSSPKFQNDLFTLPAALSYRNISGIHSGFITWFIANTLSDLLIASAMIYYLRRVWAKDGFLKNHVLVNIVRLTVETNLATASVSIVSLIMITAFPDNIYYLCPTYLIGKLYSNSLLVSLNNRILIRDTYEARGGVIDCEVVTVPAAAARSEATRHHNLGSCKASGRSYEAVDSRDRSGGDYEQSRNCGRVMPINELVVLFIVCNYRLPVWTLQTPVIVLSICYDLRTVHRLCSSFFSFYTADLCITTASAKCTIIYPGFSCFSGFPELRNQKTRKHVHLRYKLLTQRFLSVLYHSSALRWVFRKFRDVQVSGFQLVLMRGHAISTTPHLRLPIPARS